MQQPYTRPTISEDEQSRLYEWAAKARRKSGTEIQAIVFTLLVENARLTAECNEHRAARGLELMEVHHA